MILQDVDDKYDKKTLCHFWPTVKHVPFLTPEKHGRPRLWAREHPGITNTKYSDLYRD